MNYTAILNPYPEKYKRVILSHSRGTNLKFGLTDGIWEDPNHDNAIIAPPRIVDESIRRGKLNESFIIEDIQDPDPNEYPEYLAIRIRGDVPLVAKYADMFTDFDPRFHKAANSLLLSEKTFGKEKYHEVINEDRFAHGNPAPLEMVEEMSKTPLLDLTVGKTEYFPGYKKLISIGRDFDDEFESVTVKYGGSLYLPRESTPHGKFSLTSIYLFMDYPDEEVFDKAEDVFKNSEPEIPEAHEFNQVREGDENPRDINYVRAWWD